MCVFAALWHGLHWCRVWHCLGCWRPKIVLHLWRWELSKTHSRVVCTWGRLSVVYSEIKMNWSRDSANMSITCMSVSYDALCDGLCMATQLYPYTGSAHQRTHEAGGSCIARDAVDAKVRTKKCKEASTPNDIKCRIQILHNGVYHNFWRPIVNNRWPFPSIFCSYMSVTNSHKLTSW